MNILPFPSAWEADAVGSGADDRGWAALAGRGTPNAYTRPAHGHVRLNPARPAAQYAHRLPPGPPAPAAQ